MQRDSVSSIKARLLEIHIIYCCYRGEFGSGTDGYIFIKPKQRNLETVSSKLEILIFLLMQSSH